MELLKLVIADDERIILNGFTNCVDWDLYGIKIVGQALNGRQALEIIEQEKPQILFTDILMPVMDGFELIRQLREKGYSDLKVVILSGHDEFEYAKKAMKLGAVDYILKPTCPDNLDETIRKVVDLCRSDTEKEAKEREILAKLHRSLPLMKDKFFNDILSGVVTNDKEQLETGKLLGLELEGSRFLVFVIAPDYPLPGCSGNTERDRQLTWYAVYNLAQETIGDRGYVISNNKYGIPVILKYADEQALDRIKSDCGDIAEKLRGIIKESIGISVTIGIGGIQDGFEDVRISYEECIDALSYRISLGPDSLIYAEDICRTRAGIRYPAQEIRLLSDEIKMKNGEGVIKIIERIFSRMKSAEALISEHVERISNLIVSVTVLTLIEMGRNMEEILGEKKDMMSVRFSDFKSLEQIHRWFLDLFDIILSGLMEITNAKNLRLCGEIIEFIKDNYNKDITLNTISQKFFLTPNYICAVFKNTIGKSFKDYLTTERIGQARALIKVNRFSFYEIAEMVGYKNYEHFRKIFKETTGYNPSEFRG